MRFGVLDVQARVYQSTTIAYFSTYATPLTLFGPHEMGTPRVDVRRLHVRRPYAPPARSSSLAAEPSEASNAASAADATLR